MVVRWQLSLVASLGLALALACGGGSGTSAEPVVNGDLTCHPVGGAWVLVRPQPGGSFEDIRIRHDADSPCVWEGSAAATFSGSFVGVAEGRLVYNAEPDCPPSSVEVRDVASGEQVYDFLMPQGPAVIVGGELMATAVLPAECRGAKGKEASCKRAADDCWAALSAKPGQLDLSGATYQACAEAPIVLIPDGTRCAAGLVGELVLDLDSLKARVVGQVRCAALQGCGA